MSDTIFTLRLQQWFGMPFGRCLADRCGAAGVEFALLLPVLVTLLIGMFDYGALAYQTMQVSAAVRYLGSRKCT